MFERFMAANLLLMTVWFVSQFIVSGKVCEPGLWARFTGCPVAGSIAVAQISETRGPDGIAAIPVHNGRGGDYEEVETYAAARASLSVVAASSHAQAIAPQPMHDVKIHPWCEYRAVQQFQDSNEQALIDSARLGLDALIEKANTKSDLRVPLVEPELGERVFAYCEASYSGWLTGVEWNCSYLCTHRVPRSDQR